MSGGIKSYQYFKGYNGGGGRERKKKKKKDWILNGNLANTVWLSRISNLCFTKSWLEKEENCERRKKYEEEEGIKAESIINASFIDIIQIDTSIGILRSYWKLLYSLHIGLTLLHKYMSTECWPEFTRVDPDPCDTITCNTTCVVDNSRYPTGLSANYCLTPFTCILFQLLEYVFLSTFLCVPHVFLLPASQQKLTLKNPLNYLQKGKIKANLTHQQKNKLQKKTKKTNKLWKS